jgi:hypothetical protein
MMMAILLTRALPVAGGLSAEPLFIPPSGASRYIYSTRQEAAAGCRNLSKVLCSAAQLKGHSECEAGWLKDSEGYWMAKSTAGCGSAGFNAWSGPAGAYCCPAPPGPGTPGKPRVIGWYDMAAEYQRGFPIADIDFSVVSHIVAAEVSVSANGSVSCDPSFLNDTTTSGGYAELYHRARAWSVVNPWSPVKLLAQFDAPPANILINTTNRANFMASVHQAVAECDIDGFEASISWQCSSPCCSLIIL